MESVKRGGTPLAKAVRSTTSTPRDEFRKAANSRANENFTAQLDASVSDLLAQSECLVSQLNVDQQETLLDSVVRGDSPIAKAVRSTCTSSCTSPRDRRAMTGMEDEASRQIQASISQLLGESESLIPRLASDQQDALLRSLKGGDSPIAQAVRSTCATPRE